MAKFMRKIKRKTNPLLVQVIDELRKQPAPIWRDVARRLIRPCAVNLSRINRYAKAGECVVIPGKVLSSGKLEKKITIGAFSFSKRAEEEIEKSGSKAITLLDLVRKNPKGKNIRIMV
jgi:large subunit ribosomal protein L18e